MVEEKDGIFAFITYDKRTGEIISQLETTSPPEDIENLPDIEEYSCAICEKEWSKEGIENSDIIFDVMGGDEFSYSVDNPDKKPPYKCPKCEGVLILQSNYKREAISIKQMQIMTEKKATFVKRQDGKIELIQPKHNISDIMDA